MIKGQLGELVQEKHLTAKRITELQKELLREQTGKGKILKDRARRRMKTEADSKSIF